MKINTVEFPDDKLLNSFLSTAEKKLFNPKNITEFVYPEKLRKSKKDTWEKYIPEIRRQNESKLKNISAKSGVYALFTKSLAKDKW